MSSSLPLDRADLPSVLAAMRRPEAEGGGAAFTDEALRLLWAARRSFLDALPIAAVMVARWPDGRLTAEAANAQFEKVAGVRLPVGEQLPLAPFAMLRDDALGPEVEAFLTGDGDERQFGWREGNAIGGRHFAVRLGRVEAAGAQAARCLVTLLDRTAEVETARSLRSEMLHDSLTGLPNRVAFGEAVDQALADAAPFGVLVVNLRRFSSINESLGGVAGDELIITVARRLMSTLRPGDLLARTGGDEFGVLVGAAMPTEAVSVAERLHAALQSTFRLCDVELRLEAAIGISTRLDGDAAEALVRHAQFAAKCAKRSGRIERYRPAQARQAHRRFAIETELRRAIERGGLHLAFQPVLDLGEEKVVGFEALTRWCHPDQGEISPAEFIPVAEEAGLIVPLGRWALEEAARTLAGWDRDRPGAPPLGMAVNVSAVQIAHDDVAAVLAAVLARHDLAGERLTLELTESVIINDPDQATRTLEALKEHRARIALDDFGTGYSSLAYLRRLPIDVLKIDRSFVGAMLGDRDAVAIVRAVLGLAETLGMKTTAEGVETPELARILRALGCRYAQGYHYARPLPAADAIRYARDRA